MKNKLFLICFLFATTLYAQVGINTTTPNAQLEIKSSSETTPTNTDGIIIPKINAFPATNPTAAQQGMMVFLTTTVGANLPGFYYWDNTGTPAWKPVAGAGGTLDNAYDFGGAGLGKTITADAGAVLINGTDGLLSTGTIGSGIVIPNTTGARMFWYPRKAAFRAGSASGTQWDDANIGTNSVAFGLDTTASGFRATAFGINTDATATTATAFGSNTIASGSASTSFGSLTTASGSGSTAFGGSTTASGLRSTAFGFTSIASADVATAFGSNTTASGFRSTAFGFTSTANGDTATAFGDGSIASGITSTAFGNFTVANGNFSTAFGSITSAIGTSSTSFGNSTTANGINSTAFGTNSTANGSISTAFGQGNTASSYGETVLGIGATTYTTSANGATQFRAANTTDRLLVVGNAIDANNNNAVDASERRDALIILKNGLATLPSTSNTMIDTAGAKTVVTKEWVQANSGLDGSLNDAYDYGGPGLGKTITADAGAVLINGTDGFVSTGVGPNVDVNGNLLSATGALAPSGAGTRLVWNPRKAALRAGSVTGSQWDDINIGVNSIALGSDNISNGINSRTFGHSCIASGICSTALGHECTASGYFSAAFGANTLAQGDISTAFGVNSIASGEVSTAFGDSTEANGVGSTAFGIRTKATSLNATAFGYETEASGAYSTSFGYKTATGGAYSTSFGRQNTALSYGETVLGVGATTYTTSVSGATQFTTASASDRLLVVGNAVDADGDNGVDPAERSDALVILKNGNTGIGTSTPARRLHVATGVSGGTPNAASDFVLESNGPVYQHFLAPSNAETGLLFGSNVGSIRGGVLFNNVNESLLFRTGGNSSRMFITNAGDVGIGVAAPGGQFQLSLDEGRKPATSTWTIVSDKRLKNINGNYTKGLNEIIQLNPVRYNYKNTGTRNFEQEVLDTEFSGFIAQEVQPLFPDAVKTDDDGYLSFNMHSILVASINAFKELNDKNKQLDNKAAQMEKANLNLELEIQLLKNKLQSQLAINQSILERLALLEKK